jgi:hypothetical protein
MAIAKLFSRGKEWQTDSGFITVGCEQVAFAITRSRKRKRTIAFRMESDATVRVLAPTNASIGYVTKFLQSRAPWIAQRLAEREKSPLRCDFSSGSLIHYQGYACKLTVTQGGGRQSCTLRPHELRVHVPDAALVGEALRQEVRFEILLWIKKRARVKFKRRLDFLALRMGVSYKKLIVTDPERRWGSCSADNIIRLNWRLMLAPLSILDYVIAHELAHVRHKNHSPRFWSFLGQTMPDWQARRKILRTLERELAL